MAFFATRVSIIYSTSVNNKGIAAYFLEHQLTGPLFNIKINLDVDFFVTLLPI